MKATMSRKQPWFLLDDLQGAWMSTHHHYGVGIKSTMYENSTILSYD
jgi:hypothetical protein